MQRISQCAKGVLFSPKDLLEKMAYLEQAKTAMTRKARDGYKRRLDKLDKVLGLRHEKRRKRRYSLENSLGIMMCCALEQSLCLQCPEGLFGSGNISFLAAAQRALAGASSWFVFTIPCGVSGARCWIEGSVQREKRLSSDLLCGEIPLTGVMRRILPLFDFECPDITEDISEKLQDTRLDKAERELIDLIRSQATNKVEVSVKNGGVDSISWNVKKQFKP